DATGSFMSGASASVDGLGRRTTRGDTRLEWGPDNQLAAATSTAGDRTEYIHDEQGNRIAWRRGGAVTELHVDGVRVTLDHVEEITTVGSHTVGRLVDGKLEMIPLDARGSVTGDASGHAAIAGPFAERDARPEVAPLVDYANRFADAAIGTI